MRVETFNNTIGKWIKDLEQYNFSQLCAKPFSNSWSLGQVYMHLINETNFYLGQVKICASANDNINEKASPDARSMFANNDFPDQAIEGPPANQYTPQPGSKDELLHALFKLKQEVNDAASLIINSSFKGKTKHPGLNYFTASEWFQFAEMHFRHHERQKKKIAAFLKASDN